MAVVKFYDRADQFEGVARILPGRGLARPRVGRGPTRPRDQGHPYMYTFKVTFLTLPGHADDCFCFQVQFFTTRLTCFRSFLPQDLRVFYHTIHAEAGGKGYFLENNLVARGHRHLLNIQSRHENASSRMVSSETRDSAPEVATRSLGGDSPLLLLRLRVSVAAVKSSFYHKESSDGVVHTTRRNADWDSGGATRASSLL